MSPRKDRPDEMRPEYDSRGGVRGKYFERYRRSVSVWFENSPLVARNTAARPQDDAPARSCSWFQLTARRAVDEEVQSL